MDKKQLKHDPVAETLVHLIAKLKANQRSLMLYGGVILFVIIGTIFYFNGKKQYPQKASFALSKVNSQDSLKKIVKDYKDNIVAPAALCQLGYLAAQQTNYVEALGYYRTIANDYPDSFLTPAAILAIAKCYIAQGKYTEAESVLKREVLYDKNNYIAQLLSTMGRYAEAIDQLQIWNQLGGNRYFSYLGDGIQEKLLRVTGLSTNLISQQSNENPKK